MSVVEPLYGPHGWRFGDGPGTAPDTRERRQRARRDLSARRSALHRPRERAGAVGQGAPHHRQQRVAEIIRMLNARVRRASPTCAPTTIRRPLRARSTASTPSSTRTSTTASTAPASPPRRRPTRRRSARCLPRSTSSSSGCRGSAISRAGDHRGRLAAVHRRWCASTRSITATSSATCGASSTIPTCRTTCATSTSSPASPRP